MAAGVRLLERLAGGEWGAYLGDIADGRRVVFKPLPVHSIFAESRVRAAVGMAESLRVGGYPAPRYLDVVVIDDQVCTLQEFVSGHVPVVLGTQHATSLIELWSSHQAAAPVPDRSWGEALVERLRDPDSPDQRMLRGSSDSRIRRLAMEMAAVGLETGPGLFRSGDIVHGDFHHRNLLTDHGRVTAVIDWEGARAGDSRWDLVTLGWSSPPGSGSVDPAALALVRTEVDVSVPTEVRRPLAAAMALEKLAYGLRAGPAARSWAVAITRGWLRPQWVR